MKLTFDIDLDHEVFTDWGLVEVMAVIEESLSNLKMSQEPYVFDLLSRPNMKEVHKVGTCTVEGATKDWIEP